ncbi:ATP-binding protein [Bacillus thuringiensis]|uniref:ATP-binding protein n=1 Tax=Bacillus thuringiensis TaxID=1428 RepID=UPI002DB791D8|nr:ATP-binding protein [Bacillus thuringiensis]MEC2723032.1 ATP-binding protein [Bacillus thuringiensis]
MRSEKRRPSLTPNINFKTWDEVFQDPTLSNDILYRVLHHATVVSIVGQSYRIKDHFSKEND